MKADQVNLSRYVIGTTMIQYELLEQILDPIKSKIKSVDYINWFIDANSIFCRFYTDSFADQLERIDESYVVMDIVTCFMNMIGHYRKYSSFKLHKKNVFYITFDYELTPYQEGLFPLYREKRMNNYRLDHPVYGRLNQLLRLAYQFITALCSNFDDIHAIGPDTGLDGMSIQYLIKQQHKDKNCINLFYTRNLPMIQVLDESSFMIFNKRNDSYMITSDNALYHVVYDNKIRKKVKESIRKLPVALYPFVAILGGSDKFMDHTNLCKGPVSAIDLVYELYKRDYITKKCTMYSFLDALERYRKNMMKSYCNPISQKRAYHKKNNITDTPDSDKPNMDQLILRRRLLVPLHLQTDGNITKNTKILNDTASEIIEELSKLPDDFYNVLINRYRVMSLSVTASAATSQQILSVNRYLRSYQFNQNYLEHINELLSEFGPTMQLLEISVLNSSDPSHIYDNTYQGEWI